MAKNLFRPQEIQMLQNKVYLNSPFEEEATTVDVEPLEEYSGPTADDLRREAEAFTASWEAEKAGMIDRANEEVQRILKEAEQRAFEEVKRLTDESHKVRQQAETEHQRIIKEAEGKAEEMIAAAQAKVDAVTREAYEKGLAQGREEGWQDGQQEVARLSEQFHKVISAAIEKRREIIDETETQLINLVLQISKKVVKVISENQKNVVINNCIQALRKLRSRGDVIIRVNLEDVQMTSDHINDFMKMVESVRTITVMEDSSVDRGGCIVETDFGLIDARISSQFKEIEEKILDLTPIKIDSGD
ncbi:MAG: flagellar assembly protein FliH [Spirochaetales bacterium]|jgi:flagellar assembly protein FliH|nr:flagellar assembly protein FliH [Spirochaetales bacterium]